MRKLILIATAATLSFGAYATVGLCQAAAEYSATTAGAGSASANVGSGLGSALNNATGQVSERVGAAPRIAPQPSGPGNRARRVVAVRPLPANARAIESARRVRQGLRGSNAAPVAREIRAAAPGCTPSPAGGSVGNNAADSKATPACKPEPKVEYPSSLTLSFPK